MAKHGWIKLRHVLLGEERFPVALFNSRSDLLERRDEALCPVCRERVTLVRRHKTPHVRHPTGSKCIADSRPETALHYNLKFHLKDELDTIAGPGATLSVQVPCSGRGDFKPDTGLTWFRCPHKNTVTVAWAKDWDTVAVEEHLHVAGLSRKPDVVLLRAGKVIAGVEVRHSNPVTAEKESDLALMGVPWVEVKARQALIDGEGRWSARLPLPVLKVRPDEEQCCRACANVTARARQAADQFAHLTVLRNEREDWKAWAAYLQALKRRMDTLTNHKSRSMASLSQTVQDIYADPTKSFRALTDDVQLAIDLLEEKPERFGTLKKTRKYYVLKSDRPARALLPTCASRLQAILDSQSQLDEFLDDHKLTTQADLNDRIRRHTEKGNELAKREKDASWAYQNLVMRKD